MRPAVSPTRDSRQPSAHATPDKVPTFTSTVTSPQFGEEPK
jgi:hypothetical protein